MTQRNKSPFIIAMMDIDHFKQINDTFGHDVGDRVLKEMGYLIAKFFREEDIYGRVGGEEFALFMGNCTAEQAKSRFSALLERIPDRIKLPDRDVTVSLGFISSTNHSELAEYNELLLKADQALYYAKQNGRNQWAYYHDLETSTDDG
jgi:diguanylate cyclase (GGDEF)-like protein